MKDVTNPHLPVGENSPHLLAVIRSARETVGDGLTEDELTRLLQKTDLPVEAGFSFLSLSAGMVTFNVPLQDLTHWYPDQGWIHPLKEKAARALAEKYHLCLCEPPDHSSSMVPTADGLRAPRHHLEFTNGWTTVLIAHPCYLKVRLFLPQGGLSLVAEGRAPLPSGPELLKDLSTLY